MVKAIFPLLMGIFLFYNMAITAEIYRWIDKNGTIYYSDSPPPYGSFKKQKIQDQIDQSIDQKKNIEKNENLNELEKAEQRIQAEIEYQKKAKAIRDYNTMREELTALEEKYKKKYDDLNDSWYSARRRSSTRTDISKEITNLKREYQKEIRRIKDLYGYY
jgi:hypothetical protein